MDTARQLWRPMINAFNPIGTVRPEDVRLFFVDRHADDPTRSLVRRFTLDLQNSLGQPQPYKGLLTGHVGSGKSSERIRTGQELGTEFLVVWFDAELSLTTEKANHFDVLLGMGLAVHAAAASVGLRLPSKLVQDFVKSFARFVRKYEERKGFTLNVSQLLRQVCALVLAPVAGATAGPLMAAGVQGMLNATRLELNVRDDLVRTLELPANREQIIRALNSLIQAAEEAANKPLLIIIDGLDKVPVSRARALFAESSLLTDPACALVYAAPIEFYHHLVAGHVTHRFHDYRMLPNPPVTRRPPTGEHWQMDRDAHEDGLRVMQRVVARRLRSLEVREVGEVITPEALKALALASGWVMRELVRSVREAATFAQLLNFPRIDATLAQRVLQQQRQEVTPRLTVDHREALRRVLQQGALHGGQHEAIEDALLRSLSLLSYEDDQHFWFDAHPHLLPLL